MRNEGTIATFATALVLASLPSMPGYAQDAGHGKTVFKACAACHALDQANRVGPGLGGIVGRKAGSVPGFRYSDAMKNSDIVWDVATLDVYLESPQKAIPGNKMPYAGLKNPMDRVDLVAYLATLK
jgi:cytochrome c